jgi:apolipoprotein N-acyltransferase
LIWDESENTNRFRQLLQLSQTALTNQSDLLIWPESAVPEFDDASYAAITNLIRAHRVWLILNAEDDVPRADLKNPATYDAFNAAFLLDPAGHFDGVYHKQKLVIFGEYIPLVRWLPFVRWFTPITGGFAAGNEPVQFQINRASGNSGEPIIELNNGSPGASSRQTANSSPLICYEDMFPQVARGAVRADTDFPGEPDQRRLVRAERRAMAAHGRRRLSRRGERRAARPLPATTASPAG